MEPITVRGLCADIAGALELARQRSAERFRRAEDRLYQAQRQVAALESGGEDASEEDAPAAEIRVAGRRADGKLVEVSQRRLVVRVPSGSTADLCAGIEALVVVRSPSDGARVDIPVTTARRVDRQDHVLYTFTVTAPERLVALPLSLTALFDNRRDFRVTPDARAALHAELLVAGAATPVSAHVLDISASGIGLRARCDAALLASWGTRITVRVHFPGRSNPFAARARLRNVSAMPGGCRVGLSFAAESAEELADIQREVGDYVRSRHRELRPATHQLASYPRVRVVLVPSILLLAACPAGETVPLHGRPTEGPGTGGVSPEAGTPKPTSDAGRRARTLGSASWTAEGTQAAAQLGRAVAIAGDVDGDGFDEVLAGAPGWNDTAGSDAGAALLFPGSDAGPAASASWTTVGDEAYAEHGFALAGAGDLDADGFADVVVGAPGYDALRSEEGRAQVFMGSPDGLRTSRRGPTRPPSSAAWPAGPSPAPATWTATAMRSCSWASPPGTAAIGTKAACSPSPATPRVSAPTTGSWSPTRPRPTSASR